MLLINGVARVLNFFVATTLGCCPTCTTAGGGMVGVVAVGVSESEKCGSVGREDDSSRFSLEVEGDLRDCRLDMGVLLGESRMRRERELRSSSVLSSSDTSKTGVCFMGESSLMEASLTGRFRLSGDAGLGVRGDGWSEVEGLFGCKTRGGGRRAEEGGGDIVASRSSDLYEADVLRDGFDGDSVFSIGTSDCA